MTNRKKVQGTVIISALCVMGAAGVCQAAPQNGWVKEGSGSNGWYYYVRGEKLCNAWALAGNDWYYLGENGEMVTNSFINNDEHYTTQAPDNSYADWYYVMSDGRMATGWLEVGYLPQSPSDTREEQWYYFGSTGVMYSSSWIQGAASWYYVLENGVMLTNAIGTEIRDNNDYLYEQESIFNYIFTRSGTLQKGWYQDRDTKNWYYCDADGILYENRWAYVRNNWYYLGDDGIMYTNETGTSYGKYGIAEVNGEEFCFSASGEIMRGWVDVDDDRRSEKWHYFGTEGAHVVNRWSRVNGKWYFLGNTGEMVTGFLKRSGSGDYSYEAVSLPEAAASGIAYYYLSSKDGVMYTGALTLYETDGKTVTGEYYFDGDGEMVTEEVRYTTRNGLRTYCYYGSDGKKVNDLKNTTIWKGTDGKYYAAESAKNSGDKVYAAVDENGVIRVK